MNGGNRCNREVQERPLFGDTWTARNPPLVSVGLRPRTDFHCPSNQSPIRMVWAVGSRRFLGL
mgnify:CR=1 FL=1